MVRIEPAHFDALIDLLEQVSVFLTENRAPVLDILATRVDAIDQKRPLLVKQANAVDQTSGLDVETILSDELLSGLGLVGLS